ncbi:MAG: hypothetical protein ACRDSE_16250 [Pseudonocardiaceae bacterium]
MSGGTHIRSAETPARSRTLPWGGTGTGPGATIERVRKVVAGVDIVGYLVLVLGLVTVIVATVQVRRLRATVAGLAEAADDVAEHMHALPRDLIDYLGEGDRLVLTAELLNPVELAAEKTWIARPLTAVNPNLLREIVYKAAATQVRKQLAVLNIEADVQVHRAR